MYRIYNHVPTVRCVCGQQHSLLRATVCTCGATLRIRRAGKRFLPYGVAPDNYPSDAQPYRFVAIVAWTPANRSRQ